MILATLVLVAAIPVGFAKQPEAPVHLVAADCDSSTVLAPGVGFQVGAVPRGGVQVASFRIGRVKVFEPRGSTRDRWTNELPNAVDQCGAMIAKVFISEPKGSLRLSGVWLYIAEVVFTDGTRWSVGSADDGAFLQKELAGVMPR